MKIHILFKFVEGPWGGGNQFLRALKEYFSRNNFYTGDASEAEVILFNLNPSSSLSLLISEVKKIKSLYPSKLIIARIDGPISLIRDKDLELDKVFFYFIKEVCDGTIFQSNWSKQNCIKLGLEKNVHEITIINAPNFRVFNRSNKLNFNKNRKIKLISTSWSSNIKKGFDVYKWLDENLNFNRYDMTFIGNSPIEFRNIRHIKPLVSDDLAVELKKNDIFITASQKDPCSNSLIEALACGLPAIVLNDGGHPEIVDHSGECFSTAEEIPGLIQKVENNYEYYQSAISLTTIDEVGIQYYNFVKEIFNKYQDGKYQPKRFGLWEYALIRMQLAYWKLVVEKINTIKEKVFNGKY